MLSVPPKPTTRLNQLNVQEVSQVAEAKASKPHLRRGKIKFNISSPPARIQVGIHSKFELTHTQDFARILNGRILNISSFNSSGLEPWRCCEYPHGALHPHDAPEYCGTGGAHCRQRAEQRKGEAPTGARLLQGLRAAAAACETPHPPRCWPRGKP